MFTAVVGTLLHFLFEWTNSSIVAALFSAVNESIWEHMTLLFYPMVVFGLVEYRFWGKECPAFWRIKLLGILIGLVRIPVVYYTSTGILGMSADWFNITIFFIAAGVSYLLEAKLFQHPLACNHPAKYAIFLLCLISLTFTVFTFRPPHIPFFRDPINSTYGFFG